MTLKLPPRDRRGKCLDPADLPALRRYQGVADLMRHHPGMTEAEAIARYDRPRGICADCGAGCGPLARRCGACYAEMALEAQKRVRAAGGHKKRKLCAYPGCDRQFSGGPTRKNCDEHSYRPGKPRVPSGKPRKPRRSQRPALPPKGWDTAAQPVKATPNAVKAAPVVPVTRCPGPPGLRDLFGVSGTVRTAAD